MIEKAKIIKIKAAGFSPVFVVHDSNRIFSLLQQDNVAWHPALLWSEFAKTKIGQRFFFFFFFFFFLDGSLLKDFVHARLTHECYLKRW